MVAPAHPGSAAGQKGIRGRPQTGRSSGPRRALPPAEPSAATLRREPPGWTTPGRFAPREVGPTVSTGWPSSPPGCSARRQPGLAAHRRPGRRRGFGLSARIGRGGPARGVALHGDRRGRRGPLVVRTPTATSGPRPPAGHLRPGRRLPGRAADRADDGGSIGALCVFGPSPRLVGHRRRDAAPAGRGRRHRARAVRAGAGVRGRPAALGLAIDAAGIGTFDWDLVTGQLAWDDRLIAMFGYDVDRLRPEHRGVQRPAAPRRPAPGDRRAAGVHRHLRGVRVEYRSSGPTARPAGCTPAAAPCAAPTAPSVRAGRRLRHHRRAERRRPGDPCAGGDAGRLLQPRPRVAVHPRQRRGRAAARAQPRGPARPVHLGRLAGGRGQRLRGQLPRRRPHRRAGRLRRLLPRAARRLVRAARLAEPRRVVGLLPRGHRAPADPGARPRSRPSAWRSWPRSAPSWPAPWTPSRRRRTCPGSSSRRWPTSASSPWSTPTGARATSAPGTRPRRAGAARALRRGCGWTPCRPSRRWRAPC